MRYALQSVKLAKWQFVRIHGKVKKMHIGLYARILPAPMNVIKKLVNVFEYIPSVGNFNLPPVTEKADIIKIFYH